MLSVDVTGNQVWHLKTPLKAKPHAHRELVELPTGQVLITIQTSDEYVEFTAQHTYYVCKKEELATAGVYEHGWL